MNIHPPPPPINALATALFTTVELNTHLIYFNRTEAVFVLCELIYDTKFLPEGLEKICCSAGTKSFTPHEYRR